MEPRITLTSPRSNVFENRNCSNADILFTLLIAPGLKHFAFHWRTASLRVRWRYSHSVTERMNRFLLECCALETLLIHAFIGNIEIAPGIIKKHASTLRMYLCDFRGRFYSSKPVWFKALKQLAVDAIQTVLLGNMRSEAQFCAEIVSPEKFPIFGPLHKCRK